MLNPRMVHIMKILGTLPQKGTAPFVKSIYIRASTIHHVITGLLLNNRFIRDKILSRKLLSPVPALAAAVFLLSPGITVGQTGGNYLYDKLNRIETTISSPHLDWGKPYAGRTVNVLFIGSRRTLGREVVELWQRMDLAYEVVLTHNRTQFGMSEGTYPGEIFGEEAKQQEALKKLSGKMDVIVLGFDAASLPPRIKELIIRKIRNGCGLLYLGKGQDLRKIFQAKRIGDLGFLSTGVRKEFEARVLGMLEQGRIAFLQPLENWKVNTLLPPELEVENAYSAYIKAILWVSGKEPNIYIEGFSSIPWKD